MGFFQRISIPGSAWPELPHPNVSLLWAAYQELDRTQWLAPSDLEALQLRQVRVLLQHCITHVPYYQKVLTGAGVLGVETMSDFRRIPFLTRELYQANFDSLRAVSLPPGMQLSGEGFTSGTNGVPIKVQNTNRDALWWSALCMRDFEWCGMDPRKRVAGIRLISFSPATMARALAGSAAPFWAPFAKDLFEQGTSFAMEIRQDPRIQLEWLRKVRPSYLISLPSNLEVLAGLLQESGQPLPGLELIQTLGESMPFEVRQRIEQGFGVPVRDVYSTSETGFVASQCPDAPGYHVHSETVLAEVLDEHDQPCRPGEEGSLVLTSLTNFQNPFIRYKILDDVVVAPGPCPCGRGLPLWSQVTGRRHPMMFLKDGRRKSSLGITLKVRQVAGVHQFQVIQKQVDHVILRVVPDRTWTDDHERRMRACIADEFESPGMRITVEKLGHLERPPGGKLKIFVVELE